jgi:hypothetical protein
MSANAIRFFERYQDRLELGGICSQRAALIHHGSELRWERVAFDLAVHRRRGARGQQSSGTGSEI